MKSYPPIFDLQLLTLSFLPGYFLFHKAALLNKNMRNKLPKAGLLDQLIIVTVNKELATISDLPQVESFLYAVSLADGIQI